MELEIFMLSDEVSQTWEERHYTFLSYVETLF